MGRGERTDEEPRSPLAAPSFIAGAAFLVLVLAGGAWLAVDRHTSAPPQAPATVTASAPAATVVSDSVCGLPAGDQAAPTGPLGAEMVAVGDGLEVPVSPVLGPGVREGVSHCYAHSPSGAVAAAVGFTIWLSSNQSLPEVVDTLVAAGPDRDRLAASVAGSWDGSSEPQVVVQGYRATVRGPDEVKVDVAVSAPGSEGLASWSLVMVWRQGDWKVQAPSNDEWGWAGVESLDGFEPWPLYPGSSATKGLGD